MKKGFKGPKAMSAELQASHFAESETETRAWSSVGAKLQSKLSTSPGTRTGFLWGPRLGSCAQIRGERPQILGSTREYEVSPCAPQQNKVPVNLILEFSVTRPAALPLASGVHP